MLPTRRSAAMPQPLLAFDAAAWFISIFVRVPASGSLVAAAPASHCRIESSRSDVQDGGWTLDAPVRF
jgi:hypothetical protein